MRAKEYKFIISVMLLGLAFTAFLFGYATEEPKWLIAMWLAVCALPFVSYIFENKEEQK